MKRLNSPDNAEVWRELEWFGANRPLTLKAQRGVLARYRGDVEAMLCYEAAEWGTLPHYVRDDISGRLTGYQVVLGVAAAFIRISERLPY